MSIKKPKLPPDTDSHHFYLEPVYDHYKKVKVIDRCEHCDHKIGEHFEERGVKLLRYEVKRAKKDIHYHMRKVMTDYYASQIKGYILDDHLINKLKTRPHKPTVDDLVPDSMKEDW